jgi:hypothetical protein
MHIRSSCRLSGLRIKTWKVVSKFTADEQGHPVPLLSNTLPVSLHCPCQIYIYIYIYIYRCYRWWHFAMGFSETSLRLRIQFCFQKPLCALRLLCGFMAIELMSHTPTHIHTHGCGGMGSKGSTGYSVKL